MSNKSFPILGAEQTPVEPVTDDGHKIVPCRPQETCQMCNSLYIKANGELPCWCGPGENLILETIDKEKLDTEGYDVFNLDILHFIRRSFIEERRLPFPDICLNCADREPSSKFVPQIQRDFINVIHLESSWLCNLDCPLCVPKASRKKLKGPPFHMHFDTWKALLGNLKRNGIKWVNGLHVEGRGEPLMHPNLARLVKAFKEDYPAAHVAVTTNANFKFNPDLLLSGVTHLRLSIDGAYPENYAIYRKDGHLEKALEFMADASAFRKAQQLGTQIEWKYILFEWNDTDDEMIEAYRIANDLEVELSFCLTPHAGKSLRFNYDNLHHKIAELMPLAKNRPSRHVKMTNYRVL